MEFSFVDLPEIAVIGKMGLCTKENSIVSDLWQQANSHFGEVAPLGMKNSDGSFTGFWGAMSDEGMTFAPWSDGFTRGLYLAGVEVYPDTPCPEGWTKWILPARRYLVADVTPSTYAETFTGILERTLPENGLKLSGAVCDFTDPATQQNRLFFPVTSL